MAPSTGIRSTELARLLDDAFDLARKLEEAVRSTERYLLFEDFLGKIEQALESRGNCERPFLKLLLLLQGSLKHLAAETLAFQQLRAIREAAGILRTPRLTELDLQDARRTLLKAGLDPTRPMGASSQGTASPDPSAGPIATGLGPA